MSPITSKAAYALMIILLIIGIIIGYGVGMTAAPAVTTVTTTVTGPAPATATVTVTEKETVTVTAPAPGAPGLRGKVLVGALLALTGVLSTYGENSKVALELAVKEVNEWLKARGEPWEIELVVEDTATDPKVCLDKIKILHGRGIKIFIGPMSSAEVSEVKSYADANKLLIIAQSSTSPALSIPGDFIFRFCPDDTIQGPAAARILYEQGIRWVIPVWRGDTWGDGLKHACEVAFKKLLEKTGEEGGFHEGIRYDPAAKEFSAEVAKLADYVKDWVDKYGKDKVGVLYIAFEESVAFFVAASAHPILSEVKWVGSDGTAGLAPLVKVKEAADFAIKTEFLSPIFAPGKSPKFEKVKNYVMEKLGRTPDAYAYAAYDALWCIALALDLADTDDPEVLKTVLPAVVENYFGATGWFKLNENGDRAFADYDLWIPRLVEGEYKWDTAGTWHGVTDSIEWADWWLELKRS